MRTKHNEKGRQSYIVQGPWVLRPVCLQLLDLCDLEKGFGVSEPVPLGIKHVGLTLFNRLA